MDPVLPLKGMLLGFSIAAPVGPIGVLCIRRTLSSGRLAGLASGLGAASADALLGCVAALGLTFLSNFLVAQQDWLSLVGGAFLCYLGIGTMLAKPRSEAAAADHKDLLKAYASTFLLTLMNPMTILAFAAIIASLGGAGIGSGRPDAVWLVAGVFAGSALWWLTLSSVVSVMRRQITARHMVWINRVSGLVILGFGLAVLLR